MEPPAIWVVAGYTLVTFLGPLVLNQARSFTLFAAALKVFKLEVIYTVALLASIAFYRLFLHRLSRFPGPKLAAL